MLSHPLLAENSLFKLVGEIFHPLFELFGLILAGLYAVWPNYGFAITGLTILIMLALTPVTVKSTKSMLAMQRLQPEMKKLQAKYKGPENREMLNQEMMKLYKENGTSPFGACLPSLLQMPFLIVLYSLIRGLSNVVPKGQTYTNAAGHTVKCVAKAWMRGAALHSDELANAPSTWWPVMAKCIGGSGWICRPFRCRITPFPGSASQAVLVLPYLVLIGAAMFLQYYQMKQMNSRNPQAAAANPQMQTMQKFFPIIFGVIYLRVPAGATIYMVVSSAMRIGTQEVMFRAGMVTPVAHEREIGSVEGARKRRRNRRRRRRSRRRRRRRRTGRRPPRRRCRRPRTRPRPTAPRRTGGRRRTAGSRPRGSERRTARRRATTTSTMLRNRRPTRGRARSGQERLDSAWSGLRWRARPSKRRPSRHWTSWGSPWAMPR